ncbi:MAG: hypothetical protein Ct9H300mP9_4180 [Candidatus Neomarinimicrobiota bacterium]|nr:MAG: hypothetical protein Ct9H300mP9_4180 [Candidatus Neomarinimicrobiota bacterium]
MGGVFSAAWSPNGNDIAFIGNKGGASDIYIYSLKEQSYRQITNDRFSDSFPSWDLSGKKIAFVSDRGDYVDGIYQGKMEDHDFHQTDIYILDIETEMIQRITDTPENEDHPIWANTKPALYYTSDQMESGIYMFIHYTPIV